MLTNQFNMYKKGEEVVNALLVRTINRVSYAEQRKWERNRLGEMKEEEIISPEKCRTRVGQLLKANRGVAANSHEDLGQI